MAEAEREKEGGGDERAGGRADDLFGRGAAGGIGLGEHEGDLHHASMYHRMTSHVTP
jgi:hypothetical protein